MDLNLKENLKSKNKTIFELFSTTVVFHNISVMHTVGIWKMRWLMILSSNDILQCFVSYVFSLVFTVLFPNGFRQRQQQRILQCQAFTVSYHQHASSRNDLIVNLLLLYSFPIHLLSLIKKNCTTSSSSKMYPISLIIICNIMIEMYAISKTWWRFIELK